MIEVDFDMVLVDAGDHARQFVAALEHLAMFAEQRPHALAVAQRRTFLDLRLRPFGGPAEGGKNGRVARKIHPVIAPLPGSASARASLLHVDDAVSATLACLGSGSFPGRGSVVHRLGGRDR